VHFFTKKVDDRFLVVALKNRLNLPLNLSYPAKTVLKIDACSGWGCTSCPDTFSCKLGLKKFSPPWGRAGAPTAPPATPVSYPNNISSVNFDEDPFGNFYRKKRAEISQC